MDIYIRAYIHIYIYLAVAPVRQPALGPTIAKRLARQRADLTGNVRRRTPAAGLPRPGHAKADAQARCGVSRAPLENTVGAEQAGARAGCAISSRQRAPRR
jgi:hypothetical protein